MDVDEIERAILSEIANDAELRAELERIPDRVAETVRSFVPVDTGTAKASIDVKARRTRTSGSGTGRSRSAPSAQTMTRPR